MLCLTFVVASFVGSFLNVCIHCLPRGESTVFPPSHCPHCQNRLGPGELVPLFSFFWQGGRCRHCGVPISWRYPLVELLTAIFLGMVYCRWGYSLETLYYGGLTALFIVIAFIDLDTYTIPTELVAMGAATALAYNLYRRLPPYSWLLGGLLGFCLFYAIYYFSRGGMGGGDVRLAGLLGLILGPGPLAIAFLLAFVGGAVMGVSLMALGRAGRKTALPFGPFLLAAGYIAMLWGTVLWHWYLNILF